VSHLSIPDALVTTSSPEVNTPSSQYNINSILNSQPSKEADFQIKSLKIISVNYQSIVSKKEAFWELMDNHSPDIVVACETWLNQSILNSEIIPSDYKLYRCDRDDSYGGVFIAVKSSINSQLIQCSSSCEMCAVKVHLTTNQPLIIIGAYRPPNRDTLYAQNLCDTIVDISARNPNSFICCTGDFNLPDIDWDTDSVSRYRYPLAMNQSVLQMSADCYFTQLVNSPTRDKNILDLFFTNRPTSVKSCSVEPGISDHDILLVSICTRVLKPIETCRKLYLWNRANFDEMRAKFTNLSRDFIDHFSINTPIEDMWDCLCNLLKTVLDEFVPFKMTTGTPKKPWINRKIRQLRRRKQKQYNLAKRTNSESHWRCFKTLKKLMQRECRKAYNQYMHHTIYDRYLNGRKKKFFRHVKSLRRDHGGIPTLVKDGIMYSTDTSKANALNKHFYSVFTNDDGVTLPEITKNLYPTIPDIEINIEGVVQLLNTIDPFKATGPDSLPSKLLKELSPELAPCLSLVFKASIHQGTLPLDWKTALVCPIFKKGDRSDPSNYRPISLTSVCCKVLEHIVYSNIMSHLESLSILSDRQFGFRTKRSAEQQLLQTIHDFALNLNNKVQTDAILLDFCKAFDKVSHRLLLHKLDHYGIRGPIFEWISSFLTGRSQTVVCNGSISDPVNVTSGVPQGTVLGPLLFLIYINDLPDCLSSCCSLFADDCLVYRQIINKNDQDILQQDLKNLELWASKWLMTFNVNKCEVLQISLRDPVRYSYVLHDNPLRKVNEARYLGVIIDSKLNFNKQVDSVCKKANSTLAFLRRNMYSCNCVIKSDAYLIYVRPVLEYAVCSWAPHTKRNIDKLEQVQRRAARFAMKDYRPTSSVTEMISKLKWDTLHHRRDTTRLQMMYKIIHQIVDLKLPDYITYNHGITRGHDYKLTVPSSRIDSYKYSYFPATITLWNKLSNETVNASSINGFANLLTQ